MDFAGPSSRPRRGDQPVAGARSRGWHREPGASAVAATAVSLGLAALGRPGYLNLGHGRDFDDRSVEALPERTHAVLDAAYGAGVRVEQPATIDRVVQAGGFDSVQAT